MSLVIELADFSGKKKHVEIEEDHYAYEEEGEGEEDEAKVIDSVKELLLPKDGAGSQNNTPVEQSVLDTYISKAQQKRLR